MQMDVVDDQPAIAVRIERRPDRAGIAVMQRRHRVEQMGEARQPRADRTLCLVIGRVAMPRADDHAMPHQRANILFVAQLGRERQHHAPAMRSEEHTSELQSLMRISYAVFCLKKNKYNKKTTIS